MSVSVRSSVVSGLELACVSYAREILMECSRRGWVTSLESCESLLDGSVSLALVGGKKKASAVRAAVSKPSCLMPFCGEERAEWCCGVKPNHGLYTQCTKARPSDGVYCKVCARQAENSSSGLPMGGDIRERVAKGAEWRDPKGRAPTTIATVLAKKAQFSGVTMEQVAAECCKFGWTMPESEAVVQVTQRGRPKKVVEVSDTDSEDGTPRKRGRPKKKAAPAAELSDLIKQQALAACAELTGPTAEEKEAAKLAKKEAAEKLKAEKKAAKEAAKLAKKEAAEKLKAEKKAAKEAAKLAKQAEKEKAKLAKKEAAEKLKAEKKAAKLAEKEAAKAAKLAKKEAAKATKLAEKEAAKLAKKEAAESELKAEKKAAKEAAKLAKKEAAKATKQAAATTPEAKVKVADVDMSELELVTLFTMIWNWKWSQKQHVTGF